MNFIRGTVDKKGNFNIVNIVVNTRDNVLKLNKVVDIAKENILKLNKDLVSLESRKSILEGEELKKLKLEIENLKQTIKKEDASLLQAEISLKDATTEFEKVVTRETESDKFITIPLDKFELLKANGYIGKEVVLGIRPEDIKDRSGEERSSSSLDINVDVAELLGAETNIYTTIGGSSICASVAARSNVRIGDKLTFELDLSKSHFFDSETEQRIK
ncbi:MAG: TOBE domain-containing protein [Acholeplasmatales bacterium]|nr:TOBE domain-containing protein [Acholeplasmatales bacterium]